MPTIAPPALVVGAPRIPLGFGLFSVLAPRENSADRWENGVTWETLTCEPVEGIGAPDCVPEDTLGMPKALDPLDAEDGEASPFSVYGHHTCSPIGNTWERATELARQHLLTREEARIEQALWTGDLGNVPNFAGANGYPALTAAGTFDLAQAWRAVARLEQVIAEAYGSQGVLHMSRELATLLTDDGQLKVSGSRLVTPLGTPVVAGTGYDSTKIVATGALFGYRSEVFAPTDRPYDLLDRANNNLYTIAERSYVIGFDPCGAAVATLTPEGE